MLELEGQGGCAMGHLNLNIAFSISTYAPQEFGRLMKEKRKGEGNECFCSRRFTGKGVRENGGDRDVPKFSNHQ
jgi:hypothetical protein